MDNAYDRNDRFELIAACDGETLATFANNILSSEPPLQVLQEPCPQLVMQRVREPVEHRPFNIGEVVITPAEVRLNGEEGFAMRPGKAERHALSGAIVDAAVAGDHPLAGEIVTNLEAAGEQFEQERQETLQRSRHTTVDFDVIEDEL
jgi:alpha-D-ribose 1-methylphosphonate 5-triphosphate synthase subunit PhnG